MKKKSMTPEEFQRRFWDFLVNSRSAYRNWKSLSGEPVEITEGQSPHGAFLKVYANRTARTNPDTLPHKSILVKENYGKDGTTLMATTVMYRAKAYDPEHQDWYWVKYLPDGTVARTPREKGNRPIAGRLASCIDCHSGADQNDYAFAND